MLPRPPLFDLDLWSTFVYPSIKLFTPLKSANDTRDKFSFLDGRSLSSVLVKASFSLLGALSSTHRSKWCGPS